MRILVLGSGGREHALSFSISQSKRVDKIFCIPGNAGISQIAECVDLKLDEHKRLIEFAKDKDVDLTIVGPEAPLASGVVDEFQKENLKIFGPVKEAAQLEASKIFAKELLVKYNIPTAGFKTFSHAEDALAYFELKTFPQVIKADGLAAGKGVRLVTSFDEARQAVEDIMEKKIFGASGERLIVEDCLEGEEASILVLTDSRTVIPLVSSQDHKQVFDNDSGPNTGGMGAYSPAPIEQSLFEQIIDTIIVPTLSGLKKQGLEYKGVLYVGLMLTKQGPKVLEFNVRFGDPETQAILPRLKTDIVEVLQAVVEDRLAQVSLHWDSRSCVCVVLASGGYPGQYEKGKIINGLVELDRNKDVFAFHAGTKLDNGKLVTSGGRVLGISGLGANIREAASNAYQAVSRISFQNLHYRKDIAYRVLRREADSKRPSGFDPGPEFKREIK